MTPKKAFLLRLLLTTVLVFVVWSFIAKQYALFVDNVVAGMVWNAGYYVERSSSVSTSLLSPLIPFLILMIGTWGISFVYKDKKINWNLILWSTVVCVLLLGFTILGQYYAVYMAVSNSMSDMMLNITSFFIATTPVLIPVVAWYALSSKRLTEIIKS